MKDAYRQLASVYDPITQTVFFGQMRAAKLAFLNIIRPDHHILIVGGGTGEEMAFLLAKHSDQSIDYLETSAAMMERAKRRSGNFNPSSVRFLSERTALREKYDIIITSFFLDLYNDEELISQGHELKEYLEKSGLWVFTDFQDNGKKRYWKIPLLRIMYVFFWWTTGLKTKKLPNFTHLFQELNLQQISTKSYYGGLIVSSIYAKKSDI